MGWIVLVLLFIWIIDIRIVFLWSVCFIFFIDIILCLLIGKYVILNLSFFNCLYVLNIDVCLIFVVMICLLCEWFFIVIFLIVRLFFFVLFDVKIILEGLIWRSCVVIVFDCVNRCFVFFLSEWIEEGLLKYFLVIVMYDWRVFGYGFVVVLLLK